MKPQSCKSISILPRKGQVQSKRFHLRTFNFVLSDGDVFEEAFQLCI